MVSSFERLPVGATTIFFGRVAVFALAQLRRACVQRLLSANRWCCQVAAGAVTDALVKIWRRRLSIQEGGATTAAGGSNSSGPQVET